MNIFILKSKIENLSTIVEAQELMTTINTLISNCDKDNVSGLMILSALESSVRIFIEKDKDRMRDEAVITNLESILDDYHNDYYEETQWMDDDGEDLDLIKIKHKITTLEQLLRDTKDSIADRKGITWIAQFNGKDDIERDIVKVGIANESGCTRIYFDYNPLDSLIAANDEKQAREKISERWEILNTFKWL